MLPGNNCWYSRCCNQPSYLADNQEQIDGCFKIGQAIAQCHPKYDWIDHTEQLSGICTNDSDWMCPMSWMTPEEPPVRELAPSKTAEAFFLVGKPAQVASTALSVSSWNSSCSAEWAPCFENECCADPDVGCFRRCGKQFSMCRPQAEAHANWVGGH